MTDQAIVLSQGFFLTPAAQLDTILRAYQLKKDFIDRVLVKDVDYGTIPGAGDKPALKKAGAEKLNTLFALYPTFEHVTVVEDWTGENHGGEPFFFYHERANLWRVINGERVLVASADGSCNSWEKKYRYRNSERVCPNCAKPAIIKGKAEYGGGWICFDKKGGCKSKFKDGDPAIEGQQLGQIKNPDVADLVNTILKMAQKRALVAATLIGTAASDYFTQDVEDFIEGEYHEAPRQEAQKVTRTRQNHTPEPPEPPSGNGNEQEAVRPYAPETVRERMIAYAKKMEGKQINGNRNVIAPNLEGLFPGDENANEKRRTLTNYLFGKTSTKDLTDAQLLALKGWMDYQQIDGQWIPDLNAVKEAAAIITAAAMDAGQQALL